MTINFILGTAAELIKVHPLIVDARARGWTTRLIATGQSAANLVDQARDFALEPADFAWAVSSAHDLARSGAAVRWFARALVAPIPRDLRGQIVIVHGDTLSTLVGAWIGRRAGARIVHVEAGLRSKRLWTPFPEEFTRRLVSRLAHVHVAPDAAAVANLQRARVGGRVICSEGNTLADAIRRAPSAQTASPTARGFALVNVHRFENLNSPARWSTIVEVLLEAATKYPLVFIAHPQTRARLDADPVTLDRFRAAGVEIHDRVPFSRFVGLLKSARFLISDGGSNQEECSYLGIPCLLLRDQTERREGLGENCVLTRFDRAVIADFLADPERHHRPPRFPARSPSATILDLLST